MTKDEMIEIVAKAYAESHGRPNVHHLDRRDAGPIIDALRESGVIPAEGTIPIARTTLLEWREVTDRLPCNLSEQIDRELWINTHDNGAIPAAPTGEGEA